MRDSLDDLETDLGRLPDVRNEPAPDASGAQQIRRALRGKHVCPFCGTQRETDLGPCMHCSLEDTPTTRSATRSKLGPWYVLQSRNPSAPGMNFATLLVLVQKGRVTARSVIRGPTTGQFWRHAAKVKGLSREFLLCWNCGGDVAKNARACPACKRLQEPPLNPDVLLENGEFSGEELAEAMWSDQTHPSSQMSVSAQMPNGREPASPVDRLTARGGVRREIPDIDPADSVILPRPQRGILSDGVDQLLPAGLEMAVFQMERPGQPRRRERSTARKVTKALVIAIGMAIVGLAAYCSFDEKFRLRLFALGEQAWTSIRGAMNNATPPVNSTTRPAQSVRTPVKTGVRKPLATGLGAPRVDGGPPDLTSPGERVSPADIEKAKTAMRALWDAGLDADLRGDFAEAVNSWEAIKALPLSENDLPIGLDARIAMAKRRIK